MHYAQIFTLDLSTLCSLVQKVSHLGLTSQDIHLGHCGNYIYLSSLYLQCILLKKRIEHPLCPDFTGVGHDLSAGHQCERCTVFACAKNEPFGPNHGRYGSQTSGKLSIYLSRVCLQYGVYTLEI